MTPPPDEAGRWIVHGERPIYENEWVTVGLADISQPSGDRFEHHTVTLPPAAMAVVLDDEGEHVLMSWRHRFVPDVWNWELPGGLLDDGEEPAVTAAREVEEETGYRPRSIEHLVTFEPWSAIRERHPEVPAAVIVLGAGSIGAAGGLKPGHFAAMRWSDPDRAADEGSMSHGVRLPEVFVGRW
jgi:8-oxo-dGTP pyrophosphatase MutT (NUDIX family)